MRKVLIRRPGGYDRLQIEDAPDPRAGPGEVAIAVEAAGVNFADCAVRMGLYASARDFVGWPVTPGFEVAGRVVEGGAGAGTRVLAVTRFGGYASRVVVPATQVFPVPEGLPSRHAAGFPTIFLTAFYALFELVRPRPGARLLVHSAAGGVGTALCQLARIAQCSVVGVVGGPHKVAAARAAGADEVIDRSREDLWPAAERHAPRGYDAVFDANGPATLKQSYRHLAPTGRLVTYGFHGMLGRAGGRARWPRLLWGYLRTPRFHPLRMVNENRCVMAFNLSYLFDRQELLGEAMGKLLGWLREGRLTAPPVTTYPFAEVAAAHRDLEAGHTVGKLVLLLPDGA